MFLPRKHRSALSKFRSGVAPLRLETGRYEGLEVDQRICPICHSSVEDEKHVLLHCITVHGPPGPDRRRHERPASDIERHNTSTKRITAAGGGGGGGGGGLNVPFEQHFKH